MRMQFVTLDVFTRTRLAGNPLAVVIDADGLEQTRMQAIAREFNLAETVFILQPADPANRARLRIFTPTAELPFAGHPTVGTAVLLGCMTGTGSAREFVLEETIGLVRCRVTSNGHMEGHASFEIPRLPAEAGPGPDKKAAADALNLTEGDIGFGDFRPQRWSAGVALTFVPIRSLGGIRRARPNGAQFDAAFGGETPAMAYLFCAETAESDHHFHARMFAPALGVPEDPATGAAAAAFAGMLSASGGLPDGRHDLRIEQGYEMGRPSLIELGLEREKGTLVAATIGGHAVIVSEGMIEV